MNNNESVGFLTSCRTLKQILEFSFILIIQGFQLSLGNFKSYSCALKSKIKVEQNNRICCSNGEETSVQWNLIFIINEATLKVFQQNEKISNFESQVCWVIIPPSVKPNFHSF